MIKIDLITGFLGSGKTTFVLKYVKYLMDKGEKVCIVENDYGAVNVDMMLVGELGCGTEMVAGGCDYDCHLRRYKTKLISIAMRGYTRVIVEPSGVYDTDEFFDVLYDEPLIDYYEIGNIFCLYDINTKNLSNESEYILVSESSVASKLIISKRDNKDSEVDLDYINSLYKKYDCKRILTKKDIMYTDSLDFDKLYSSGYTQYDHVKMQVIDDNNYDSLYVMNKNLSLDRVLGLRDVLFKDNSYGNILRIKGFIIEKGNWMKINITKNETEISTIDDGQDIVIVIGENIKSKEIKELLEG